MKNNNEMKTEYLRPVIEIVSFQPEVLTGETLSAFNVQSNTLDWLLG